jgi:hypothetical protein
MSRRPISLNPFELIARKQRLGDEEAGRLTLPFLIYLDAAKRGQGIIVAENGLAKWIAIAQIIGSAISHRPLYNFACDAGKALYRAAGRQESMLTLTTGEYIAMRKLMVMYLRILPEIEVQTMVGACVRAHELIEQMEREAA